LSQSKQPADCSFLRQQKAAGAGRFEALSSNGGLQIMSPIRWSLTMRGGFSPSEAIVVADPRAFSVSIESKRGSGFLV
jgi:hypothetical protein